MIVRKNGQNIAEIDRPEALRPFADTYAHTLSDLTLDLAEVKAHKEALLRDEADEWYRKNVRSFEGAIVTHKINQGQALNAEETKIRDDMIANYARLKTLITQVRQAQSVNQAIEIQW